MSGELGLDGRVVIVTGGGGGLGRAFAQGFARHGARVVVADIDRVGAAETAESITTEGGEAFAAHVDVTDATSTRDLVTLSVDGFGPVDVLINNAAIYATLTRSPFAEIDPEEWDRVMTVNVKGTWLMTAAALPALVRPGASIINIASATVFSGSPEWMHYVASKSAVIGMTRVLAREVGIDGIRANVIAPGFTLTEASLGQIANAASYGVDRGSLKRPALPDDIVGAALYLASPLSDYVTGQTLVVDGGKQFI